MSWRPTVYHCAIDPQWIDYNGHLRDAYYTLVFSQAIDALMDEVGLDRAYRERTGGTLYTLEMHMHYLNEVKASDTISVGARALSIDAKRLHLGLAMHCPRHGEAVAYAEFMLLHVQQAPSPKSAPLPPEVLQRLEDWHAADTQVAAPSHGSRKMELVRR